MQFGNANRRVQNKHRGEICLPPEFRKMQVELEVEIKQIETSGAGHSHRITAVERILKCIERGDIDSAKSELKRSISLSNYPGIKRILESHLGCIEHGNLNCAECEV